MSMQSIHDIVKKKWFAGTIFALITAAFMLWGVEFYIDGTGGGADNAATVNGTKISNQDVQARYQAILSQNPKLRDAGADELKQVKQAALENLINQQIISNAIQNLGLSTSQQQIGAFIVNMPPFQENGQFSQQRFQNFLMNSGLSEAQFMQQISDSLLSTQLSGFFQLSGFALPNEVNQIYALVKQTRDFSYSIITANRFANQVALSDQAIKSYYQSHIASFQTPARVKVDYIEVSPKTILDKINITDDAAKQYYSINTANYATPQEWTVERITTTSDKMTAIVAQLKKGVPFSQVFKENNGQSVTLNAGQLTDQELALLKAIKPGQLTQPVSTQDGMVLFHLISVKAPQTLPYASVEQRIKNLLKQQQANQQIAAMNNTLSNAAYTNPNSLQGAAQQLKLSIQHSDWFTQQGSKTGIAANPAVVTNAFSDDVLNQKENSNPITLEDGGVVVLRVADYQASQAVPLSAVEAKIKDSLRQQMEQAQTAILADKVVQAFAAGQTLAAVSKTNNLSFKQASNVKADSKQPDPAIVQQVFALTKTKPYASVPLANGDVAVVYLQSVQMGNPAKASDKDKSLVAQNRALEMAKEAAQLYLSAQRQAAKIKISNQA